MTLVEKLARIRAEQERQKWNSRAHGSQHMRPESVGGSWPEYVEEVRALLSAIEPTEAMIQAGVNADVGTSLGSRVTNAFNAMINAAKEAE